MEDLLKSIKAHLYERTTSPLFGTFTISWIVWNYKFIITIFSSMEVHLKFDYISTFLYPSTSTCLSVGVIYPLLTTLAFIFLYPYPAKFVYSFTRLRQKELKEIKQKIEDETPLTHEESRKLRRDMAALEIEHEKEMERRKTENQRLKEFIEELRKDSNVESPVNSDTENETYETVSSTNETVTDEQLDLLELISSNEYPNERNLIKWSKSSKVKTEFNLGELVNLGLLNDHYASDGTSYSITHEGRTLLVNEGRVE